MGSHKRSRSRKQRDNKRHHRRHSSSSDNSLSTSSSNQSYVRSRKQSKKTKRRDDSNLIHRKRNKPKSKKTSNIAARYVGSRTLTPPLEPALYNNINTASVVHNALPSISVTPVSSNVPAQGNNNLGIVTSQTFPIHFNPIPEFDPSDGSQNIESWIHKVNECSQIYSWNETQTCHYALNKLSGLAKRWYQGLPSLLFSWNEWMEKLKSAFPSTENYGDLLQRMLYVRCKLGQPLDIYYYEKMILINKCEISGRKAVGCLVHGIDDKFVRMSANACRFEEPDQLFSYLRTLAQNDNYASIRRKTNWTKDVKPTQTPFVPGAVEGHKSDIICFNCGEPGHIRSRCTKPMKRCNVCHRVGHLSKDCRNKPNSNLASVSGTETLASQPYAKITDRNVMRIQATMTDNDKYFKKVLIDGRSQSAYIDLGSNCTLVKESVAKEIFGEWENNAHLPNLRGFGNASVKPLGLVKKGSIEIDQIQVNIDLIVVADQYMPCDLIVGQTFTELPCLVMYKTSKDLVFCEAPSSDCIEPTTKHALITVANVSVGPHTTSPVEVYSSFDLSKSLYVPVNFCNNINSKYFILPGIYSFNDNKGFIMVSNVTNNNLLLDKNRTIARGHDFSEIDEAYVRITTTDNKNKDPLPSEDLKIGAALSNEDSLKFNKLLEQYRDCFALNLSELGKTDLTEMVIKLKDELPVVYNPYRMSIKEKGELSIIIEDLLKNGIIRESSSSYASPVLLVSKKNGQKRLCVDYRALNRKTLKDKYPLPRIEDKLDSLGDYAFFSSLDLASGYYQVPVAEQYKHLTAFITPDGLYEYNRMPFGLANAPSVFQRAINAMLHGANQNLVLAYMDDLLVPSKTILEGLDKLEKVFTLLRNAKLTLNLKKCVFFQESIEYLGYEISKDGVRPGTHKIEAVKKFPVPRNVHEVRQFVGLASYFRKFVCNFSIIARPLTVLTKKNEPWRFGPEQIAAFNMLKNILISRPVLALYSPQAQLQVHTDASKLGVGAILLQDAGKGLQPIAYYSRQTSPEEQKFHSYELETLAVITALNRFRVYLLGVSFKIVTDCNAIRSTMTKKDLVPRVARWWIAMQEYDFTIEYRPGARMAHVDALSRNPIDAKEPPSRDDDANIFGIDCALIKTSVDENWLHTVQQADDEIRRIIDILNDPDSDNVVEIKTNFVIKNNRLYRVCKKDGNVSMLWVVPKLVRWQIVKSNHDELGHFGFDKTYDRIRRVYWFKNMRRFIKKYCKACLHCAHNKLPGGPKEGMLHPIPKPDKPFDTLHADHCGPFPLSKKRNAYILAIIDSFTKYIYIKPVRNCKSKTTINVFEEYFSLFGVPRRLITDRGTSFTSHEFKIFIGLKGIEHILNAVATPRANGQIERYNRSIVDALTASNHDKPDNEWDVMVPRVQWGLNNTINKATGKSAAEVLFGTALTGVSDGIMNPVVSEMQELENRDDIRANVCERVAIEQKKQKERYDKSRKVAHNYRVGDLVRIEKEVYGLVGQSKKLQPKCSGPYKIIKVLENDRYEIEDTPITKKPGKPMYRGVYAVDKIHPWLVFSTDLVASDSD